jgi:hypothetical protein
MFWSQKSKLRKCSNQKVLCLGDLDDRDEADDRKKNCRKVH